MFRARFLATAAFVLGLGCSDDCHDIACEATLVIELAPEQGFADGSYEVTLESPQGDKVCSFVVTDANASDSIARRAPRSAARSSPSSCSSVTTWTLPRRSTSS